MQGANKRLQNDAFKATRGSNMALGAERSRGYTNYYSVSIGYNRGARVLGRDGSTAEHRSYPIQ
jgi:hypothetical protein